MSNIWALPHTKTDLVPLDHRPAFTGGRVLTFLALALLLRLVIGNLDPSIKTIGTCTQHQICRCWRDTSTPSGLIPGWT